MHRQLTQQGFTLIEVLVALVIMAVAVPAMMSAIGTQANNLSHVKEKTMAQWVASNKVVELQLENRLSGAVPTGKASGDYEMGGIKWEWRSEVKEFEVELLQGVHAVEVKVYPEGAQANSSVIDGEVSPLVTQYTMMFERHNKSIANLAAKCASARNNPDIALPYYC